MGHHAAHTDHRAGMDGHARLDEAAHADPHVVPDDRLRRFDGGVGGEVLVDENSRALV